MPITSSFSDPIDFWSDPSYSLKVSDGSDNSGNLTQDLSDYSAAAIDSLVGPQQNGTSLLDAPTGTQNILDSLTSNNTLGAITTSSSTSGSGAPASFIGPVTASNPATYGDTANTTNNASNPLSLIGSIQNGTGATSYAVDGMATTVNGDGQFVTTPSDLSQYYVPGTTQVDLEKVWGKATYDGTDRDRFMASMNNVNYSGQKYDSNGILIK